MQSIRELSEKISSVYGQMSPNFRKIAAFMLDNPEDVALYSMRKNAKQLNLNPSTLVRFAHQLSFAGYPELRRLFQEDLKSKHGGYLERAQNLQNQHKQERISAILSNLHLTNKENLKETADANSVENLKKCTQLLLEARHIYIFGLRICFPAAFALHYACKMLRENVYLSEGLGGTLADDMRGMGEEDVLVIMGMEPYSNLTVNAARFGVRSGAKIIALTDSVLSPLALNSDTFLTFNHSGPLIPGSIIPLMALVEAITTIMIAKSGDNALSTIKNSEQQLKEFYTYFPKP